MHFSDYKFLGALACAVAAAACVGQSRAGNLDVKSLAYHGKIPYVVSDDNRVAQRINNVIFLHALEIVPPATFKDGMP